MSDDKVDTDRRRFLRRATSVVGGVGVAAAAVPFVASLQPSAKAKAVGAPVEADISNIQPGRQITEKWRGKPVWIVRRRDSSIKALSEINDSLRDPDSRESQQPEYAQNEYRSINPEYFVVVGICTHLGCSPTYLPVGAPHDLGPDWRGGFFCPCHGSRFDLAGRVYKGVPAPTNLVVPPYKFLSDTRLLIGSGDEAA